MIRYGDNGPAKLKPSEVETQRRPEREQTEMRVGQERFLTRYAEASRHRKGVFPRAVRASSSTRRISSGSAAAPCARRAPRSLSATTDKSYGFRLIRPG